MSNTPRIDKLEKNLIINGNFDFWQRGTTFTANGALYTADRFLSQEDGGGTRTISRSTDVPNNKSNYSYLWTCDTADVSLDAADLYNIEYRMEGSDFQQILGETFTLSFYTKSNKIGTYSVAFLNADRTRSYVTEYTINVANTWEKKTITVNHNSSGTWITDSTNAGMRVIFGLGVGSDKSTATIGSWQSGDFRGTSNSPVNIQDTVSNTFQLSQVMLNDGKIAGEFNTAGRNVKEELQMCQRYFEKSWAPNTLNASQGEGKILTAGMFSVGNVLRGTGDVFKTNKRATPTVSMIITNTNTPGTLTRVDSNFNPNGSRASIAGLIGTTGFNYVHITGRVSTEIYVLHWTADSEI